LFKALDDRRIHKDYQMYFKQAILHLKVLNDPVQFELLIGKMKNIIEINKIFQKNYTGKQSMGQTDADFCNFMIVDANGNRFGRILQMNSNFRELLGWSEE
jgi:hypothetical protein